MPSPAQYAANRLNSEKSTGPSTPKGKVRSSLNALRHGLTARVVILPSEDMAAYNAFTKEIVDSLDARTPLERQFAQTVADNQWRINRIRSIEDGMLADEHFGTGGDFDAEHADIHSTLTNSRAFRTRSKEFANLSMYELRLNRAMMEALRELKELQAERRERMTQKEKRKNGFVYASPRPSPRPSLQSAHNLPPHPMEMPHLPQPTAPRGSPSPPPPPDLQHAR
jgi:uncharacterized protein with von Willebrand factor type A (vWA) domain